MWNQIAAAEAKLKELRQMRTGNAVVTAAPKDELLVAHGLQPLYATALRHIDQLVASAIVDAEAERPINPAVLKQLKAFRDGFKQVREV